MFVTHTTQQRKLLKLMVKVMEKIINFFKQWDKLAHMTVCLIVMLVFTAIASMWFLGWVSLLIGTGVTALCAFGKEGLDSTKEGNVFSWDDIIADATGYGIALISLIMLFYL